jgi:hypothetical protein
MGGYSTVVPAPWQCWDDSITGTHLLYGSRVTELFTQVGALMSRGTQVSVPKHQSTRLKARYIK